MSSTHTCRLMIDQLVNDEWFAVEMNPSTPFDLGDPSRARGVLSDVRSVYLVIRHFNVRASSRLAGARRLSLLALCMFCSPSGRKNGKHASSTRKRRETAGRQRKRVSKSCLDKVERINVGRSVRSAGFVLYTEQIKRERERETT